MQENRKKTHYVLGFMFDKDREVVALITKQKPDWQAGKLNGIGGKIESGELPAEAMAREFKEESGVTTRPEDWEEYARIKAGRYSVYCFRLFNNAVYDAKTMEAEQVSTMFIHSVWGKPHIPNLPWLLSLALDPEPLGTAICYP